MANATSTTISGTSADANSTIEALLQQRAQYEQWIARLDSAVENAPNAVRERVRSDYEGRLRQVIEQLRGYATTITQELEHHRAVESQLNVERQRAEEALAEAEVRHIVGEYGDEEWQRLSGESERRLEALRSELRSVSAEIARLAEVQTLIAAPNPNRAKETAVPPVAPAAPTPVAKPVQLEIGEPTPVPTPVATAPTPAPVPQAAEPSPAPVRPAERQPEPVASPSGIDELAFLKSVSDDDRKPAAPPRRSGPSATAPAKPAEPAAAAPTPAPAPAATGAGKTAGMAKTLKCNECGTFNRPTEWYCERCGAELAAL